MYIRLKTKTYLIVSLLLSSGLAWIPLGFSFRCIAGKTQSEDDQITPRHKDLPGRGIRRPSTPPYFSH
jgi:hypothetical protein